MGIGKNQYGQTYNFRSGTYSRPLSMWICIVQICVYKFVLIYDWQTQQKNFRVQKKELPLWAQVHGNVYVQYQKNWDTGHTIWDRLVGFCFCTRTIRTAIQDSSISMPYSQPLSYIVRGHKFAKLWTSNKALKKGDLPKNNHFITFQIDGQSPNLF